MATLAQVCLLYSLIILLPLRSTRGEPICETMSCGEIKIRFPFSLKGGNQSAGCSYPRFQLSCDNQRQTILTLPGSGDLVVKGINYEDQTVKVNDPDECLPKRFLQNLTVSLSPPFTFDATVYDLTFLRCPSNINKSHALPLVPCLSGINSSLVMFSWWQLSDSSTWHECGVISSAFVPIPNPHMATPDLNNDVELKWNQPACGECAARGKLCGFTGDSSLQVGCFSSPNQSLGIGLPRSAKYGLTIGLGIPGLLCLIGLSCFICSKFNMYGHHQQGSPNTEIPSTVFSQQQERSSCITGLDGPKIEKFPRTVIGESGRLPNSNDNTCPICLSEYEAKEILRTISECSHYFHAQCIDEWLRMNATCPLCRKSPDSSSSLSIMSSSSS